VSDNVQRIDATRRFARAGLIVSILLIAGGYALIRERYDWSTLGAKLLNQYQAMASETSRSIAD